MVAHAFCPYLSPGRLSAAKTPATDGITYGQKGKSGLFFLTPIKFQPKSVIRPPGIYFCSFSGFPSAFALPAASCLPLCLDVARYAFYKGDCQSVRRQYEITLDSNDRFGLKAHSIGVAPRPATGRSRASTKKETRAFALPSLIYNLQTHGFHHQKIRL